MGHYYSEMVSDEERDRAARLSEIERRQRPETLRKELDDLIARVEDLELQLRRRGKKG